MYTTLISVPQLHQLFAEKTPCVLVDCRHDLMDAQAGQRAFDAGHLPHAVFANVDTQLSGAKFADNGQFLGRHPLPPSEQLIQTLRELGINDGTQVIAYDAQGGMYAARLWWLLRSIGHQQVAVLDGGMAAWQEQGLTLQTQLSEVGEVKQGTLTQRTSLTQQVDVQMVLNNVSLKKSQQKQVVDARSPDRFRGENETIDPVGGHIPGAKNRFFKDNLQTNGCFKSAQQLKEEWMQIIGEPQAAIMQCGSGITACHNLLALEIAGLTGAALYPGSWSEWCADASRPVAVGS